MEINKIVDDLIASRSKIEASKIKPRPRMRIRSRKGMIPLGVIGAVLIGSILVTAAIFNYFQTTSINVDSESLLLIDSTPAEDFDTSFNFPSATGGDDYTFYQWYNLSSAADNPISFNLNWLSVEEGISCYFCNETIRLSEANENYTLVLNPGESRLVGVEIELSKFLSAGSYLVKYEVI